MEDQSDNQNEAMKQEGRPSVMAADIAAPGAAAPVGVPGPNAGKPGDLSEVHAAAEGLSWQFCHVTKADPHGVKFYIQHGPIKEVGVNGCQIDEVIKFSRNFIMNANHRFPCDENIDAITHLGMAIEALERRKANREARGVEGTDQL